MSLRRFFRRRRNDAEVSIEMESYLSLESDENLVRGMSKEEARRQAYLKFGSPERIREEVWKRNSIAPLENALRDIRYAWRTLRRSPGYAFMAILTLGLGIGANAAIFTVINGILLRPLPYANPTQIVHLEQTASRVGADPIGFSVQEIADYRQLNHVFTDLAEYHSMTFTLLGSKVPERVSTGVVSANFFDVLGVKPVLGRLITPADETQKAEPVLVLSYAYWVKNFGRDPKILGRTFVMNDRVHTVVGVLPPLPEYPDANDVYMPTTSCPFRSNPKMIADRDMRMFTVFARMKADVTEAQARRDLATITNRLALIYPKSYPAAAGVSAQIAGLEHELTHAARPTFLTLLGAAGLVLLLACANLANLAISRQMRRSQEMAIRMATGASAWDIFRQLLTESMVVALAGGVLGLGIAAVGSKLLIDYAARMTPLSGEIHLDGRVLFFVAALSIVAGVLFGALPGFVASRNRLSVLTGSGERSVGSGQVTQARMVLVAVQVALSFVLLVCAGLMLQSLHKLLSVDPGFKTANVLSMRISLDWTKYAKRAELNQFFHQVLGRVSGLPGVESAAVSVMVPLNGNVGTMTGGILLEGRPVDPGEMMPQVDFELASPDYFHVLGVPILAGRAFTDGDNQNSPAVGIVNARMAKRFWPTQDPIGRHVSIDNGKTWITIVGVASSVHQYGLDKDLREGIYLPQDQSPSLTDAHLLVRTRVEPMRAANQIADVIHQIDPHQPVTEMRSLDQLRSAQLGTPRVTTILLGLFAALALFITVVGVSGTLALAVAHRTKEIGIRIALGAPKEEILHSVLMRGMSPVIAGIAAGAVAAIFSTRFLANMLFTIKPDDPLTLGGIAILLAVVALIGCAIPARNAIRVDPMKALRTE
ncbi:ABC transporter permease [Tunturibacter psychrotolerans]|uniref:ABC transporter permease n=1 Tax=Tunturiibacter psychrotolerans TaxID=3069686 RepID=A0AAU7ZWF3_9BACT